DHRIAEVIDELIAESRARLREEKRLYDQLLAVRESDVSDWRAALNVMNLLKNLRSHDPAARQDSALWLAPAALSLGERGVLVAFDELLRMIVDGDHDVQASEVLAQSPSWHEAALDTIGALLNDDRTQEQRARLVQALAEFEDSDELLLVLLDDPTPVVALTAKAIVRTRGNMP
ncbi:MAG: MerR family transcriptional regulator, partial [Corynebacterium casei]|nr:MerR family transcriptional regulator [Corynebacterium casei]